VSESDRMAQNSIYSYYTNLLWETICLTYPLYCAVAPGAHCFPQDSHKGNEE
jgi:hypothetical protein